MKKKVCPPGQICVGSNFLVTVLVFVIILLLFFIVGNIYQSNKFTSLDKVRKPNMSCAEKSIPTNTIIEKKNPVVKEREVIIKYQPNTTSSYLVNKDHERIINPLLPPERRNHYIDPHSHIMVSEGVPINIPTRGESGGFQQVGVLHKIQTTDSTMPVGRNSEPVILPLMGAPTYNGSHKWTYYTATDKYNQIKLPITNKNRQCDSEYGCDELYDDDEVTIPAYNGTFKVKKYEFDKPRYLPHVL